MVGRGPDSNLGASGKVEFFPSFLDFNELTWNSLYIFPRRLFANFDNDTTVRALVDEMESDESTIG